MYETALCNFGYSRLWEFLYIGIQTIPNDGYCAVQTIAHPLKVA